jgi:integrase
MGGKLNALKVSRTKKPGYYGDGGGLWLQVSSGGTQSWVFRFTMNGRSREMGLGSLNTVPLALARETSRDCRLLTRAGIDPIENRREKVAKDILEVAKAVTFDACAEKYIYAHEPGWRNQKHVAQWRNTLKNYVSPVVGSLPVQAIDVGLVMKILEPIWNEKTETASRVRGRVESVLDWATARGYRTGDNPARWRGHLENLLPRRSKVQTVIHHAALPYSEISAFIQELTEQEGVAKDALKFLILTATRTSETIGATWNEFDLSDKIWVIPANRIKAGKEHRIPLSPSAMGILKKYSKTAGSDFVFPGAKTDEPLSNMALLALLRRMKKYDLTVHGFRSTFRDWAAEQTNFPREVAEMALSHAVGDKVEAAYRRGDLFDKRRQLMDSWSRYCEWSNNSAA